MFKCSKNCANWCRYFKDMGIWMQWFHLILQVKNWVGDFIAMWRHWCYKFVQYRVNRCVQNKQCWCVTKSHKSDFLRYRQSNMVSYFLAHPVYNNNCCTNTAYFWYFVTRWMIMASALVNGQWKTLTPWHWYIIWLPEKLSQLIRSANVNANHSRGASVAVD